MPALKTNYFYKKNFFRCVWQGSEYVVASKKCLSKIARQNCLIKNIRQSYFLKSLRQIYFIFYLDYVC